MYNSKPTTLIPPNVTPQLTYLRDVTLGGPSQVGPPNAGRGLD